MILFYLKPYPIFSRLLVSNILKLFREHPPFRCISTPLHYCLCFVLFNCSLFCYLVYLSFFSSPVRCLWGAWWLLKGSLQLTFIFSCILNVEIGKFTHQSAKFVQYVDIFNDFPGWSIWIYLVTFLDAKKITLLKWDFFILTYLTTLISRCIRLFNEEEILKLKQFENITEYGKILYIDCTSVIAIGFDATNLSIRKLPRIVRFEVLPK